ncbi:MAG: NADH-quinone oxidoreductase subunit J [Anaerolineae bacterium]|nr:NADH-quinone oxidoreductase subunit J [Anaerolineae bacterium]MEB2289042.1 NADH-quinone oxidoreductase subunit J [Anaerolineae bacterium]
MELTLFIIVGAIALISAALMLIGENAVYSALFLILNLLCIAFLFLMLSAPFLAMVQITVYTGAIMVLFLFVIMLLGAERIVPTVQSRFRWLAPAVVIMALVFLVTVSVALINGEITKTEPRKAEPQVRVVHALDGLASLDMYLDGEPVAQDVQFSAVTGFAPWRAGEYELTIFEAGADPASADALLDQPVTIERGKAYSLTAIGRVGAPGARLVAATHTLDFSDKKDGLRLVVVNALPGRASVDVRDEVYDEVLVSALAYGEAHEFELSKGERDVALYTTGSQRTPVSELPKQALDANTLVLWVFAEQRQPDNSFTDVVISLQDKAPTSFGSPTHIGRLLFTDYVLPFELVALLLLVAMIGAIVLTHDSQAPRQTVERRLANPPPGLEQSAPGETGD